MSTLEELTAYRIALNHAEKYLQPGVGFSVHNTDVAKKTEEQILKQNNTIIALLLLITRQIDRMEERIETIENWISDFNKTKTKEVDDLLEKIKGLNIRKKERGKVFWRLEQDKV